LISEARSRRFLSTTDKQCRALWQQPTEICGRDPAIWPGFHSRDLIELFSQEDITLT
jgi:hypothetical protein